MNNFKIIILVLFTIPGIILADSLAYEIDDFDYHNKKTEIIKKEKNKEETFRSLKIKYIRAYSFFTVCVKKSKTKEELENCSNQMVEKIKVKKEENKW